MTTHARMHMHMHMHMHAMCMRWGETALEPGSPYRRNHAKEGLQVGQDQVDPDRGGAGRDEVSGREG